MDGQFDRLFLIVSISFFCHVFRLRVCRHGLLFIFLCRSAGGGGTRHDSEGKVTKYRKLLRKKKKKRTMNRNHQLGVGEPKTERCFEEAKKGRRISKESACFRQQVETDPLDSCS